MAGEWFMDVASLEDGEWVRWNSELAKQRDDVAQAVSEFEAHSGDHGKAAAMATAWLRQDAMLEQACVTRLLLADGHVAAFYALASGETRLTSSSKLERMGIRGGSRVGSSHIEWIARDRRAAKGTGLLAVQHAIYVALRVARDQGNRALTLDPFDTKTQAMWEAQGFHKSQTQLESGLRRLYVPLFGVDYGRLKRAAMGQPKTD
jgi:hypothetical protein